MSSFWLMVSMGLLGSLHCVGMCGGLVGAVAMSRPRTWWAGLAGYQAGRIASYGALGLGAGMLGGALGGMGELVPRLLAWLAGGVMVAFGLNMAGWIPDPLVRLATAARGPIGLVTLTSVATRTPALWSWSALGLANGLLPCGLVYAALALSLAAGEPLQAMVMMIGFGLGTVPAMMLAPALLRMLTPAQRGLGLRLVGLVLVVLGVMTLMRGTMSPDAMGHHQAMASAVMTLLRV